MAKISASKIKKAIVAIEAQRSKYPDAPRLKFGEDPKLRKIKHDRNKLLVESLESAGLDTRKLSALGKQHDTELRRALDKYRAQEEFVLSQRNEPVRGNTRGLRSA